MNIQFRKLAFLALTTVFLIPYQALSFEIKNTDQKTYVIELVEDLAPNISHTIELNSNDSVSDLCTEGCLITFEGNEYIFSGKEEIIVENGELFDVSPE